MPWLGPAAGGGSQIRTPVPWAGQDSSGGRRPAGGPGDRLHDGQAEPAATSGPIRCAAAGAIRNAAIGALPGGITGPLAVRGGLGGAAMESVERLRRVLLRHAWARVGDLQHDATPH